MRLVTSVELCNRDFKGKSEEICPWWADVNVLNGTFANFLQIDVQMLKGSKKNICPVSEHVWLTWIFKLINNLSINHSITTFYVLKVSPKVFIVVCQYKSWPNRYLSAPSKRKGQLFLRVFLYWAKWEHTVNSTICFTRSSFWESDDLSLRNLLICLSEVKRTLISWDR